MNFSRMGLKVLSLIMALAMFMAVCSPVITVAANGIEDDIFDDELNYVSIGDSMTNGYGFDGYNQGNKDDLNGNGYYDDEYNFFNDVNVYGAGSYALQFEDYLVEQGYTVNHTKLAASALRAEDLLYLLGGRETPADDWFEQVLYYTDAGENGRYGDDNTPEAIEKLSNYYITSVMDADIMTLGIGNASFGAFLLSRVSGILMDTNFTEEDAAEAPTLEQALAILESDETKELVLEVYAELKVELDAYLAYAPEAFKTEQLEAALGVFAYTVAGFLINYEAVLDRIVELNPDVEIILVGLMNTTYGMNLTQKDEETDEIVFEFAFGDMMDTMFGLLNAYIAGIPAAKQLSGEYVTEEETYYYVNLETGETKDELTVLEFVQNKLPADLGGQTWEKVVVDAGIKPAFYYAEQPAPEFIVQAFDELFAENWNNIDCGDKDCVACTDKDPATVCEDGRLSGKIVRSRQIDAYNGELRIMIGYAFGFELPALTLSDVEN